jgi:uncharacterized protein YggT (Ycf19 family)
MLVAAAPVGEDLLRAEVVQRTDLVVRDDDRNALAGGPGLLDELLRLRDIVRVGLQREREVERARGMARVSQVVDYIFYVIYALLAVRLLLVLMAARSSAGFMQFIYTVTDPLYRPFRGIVASPTAEGGYTLALPIVIAIIVYALVHAGINGLLRLIAHRKTEI